MKEKKDEYFNNHSVKSNHKARIDCLSMSTTGKYLASASKDQVNVWEQKDDSYQLLLSLPLQAEAKGGKVLAAVNNDCSKLIYYKGYDFTLQLFDILTPEAKKADPEAAKSFKDGYKQVDEFVLEEELQKNNYPDSKFENFDSITEISFIAG